MSVSRGQQNGPVDEAFILSACFVTVRFTVRSEHAQISLRVPVDIWYSGLFATDRTGGMGMGHLSALSQ